MSENDLVVTGGEVLRPRSHGYELATLDVVVSGGRIAELVPPGRSRPGSARKELAADGCLVVPGFINAHNHSYAMLGRGFGEGRPLESWMPYATAVTLNRTDDEVRLAALLGCIEMARSGTTTVLDHLGGRVESLGAAAQAYLDFGMRVVLAPMIGDVPLHRTVGVDGGQWPADLWRELESQPIATASDLLAGSAALLREWHERAGRIRIFVGPSGPQRCTDDLLRGCARLAKDFETGVHTHLLESRNQAMVTRRRYGGSAVEHLDAMGLVTERFVGAHGVWCSTQDLRALAKRGAALVHNPWSNLCIGSGIASLIDWRRQGVTIALGTDGANAGCDLSMPLAMRLAVSLHRATSSDPSDWPGPQEVLAAATIGGSSSAGMARPDRWSRRGHGRRPRRHRHGHHRVPPAARCPCAARLRRIRRQRAAHGDRRAGGDARSRTHHHRRARSARSCAGCGGRTAATERRARRTGSASAGDADGSCKEGAATGPVGLRLRIGALCGVWPTLCGKRSSIDWGCDPVGRAAQRKILTSQLRDCSRLVPGERAIRTSS